MQLPCFGGVLYLLDTAGGRLSAAGRRHAAAAVARLGAMAPGNKAAEAAVRAACGCPGTGGRRASVVRAALFPGGHLQCGACSWTGGKTERAR